MIVDRVGSSGSIQVIRIKPLLGLDSFLEYL